MDFWGARPEELGFWEGLIVVVLMAKWEKCVFGRAEWGDKGRGWCGLVSNIKVVRVKKIFLG